MASVMKSQLNPLADTFIPSCRPIPLQKKGIGNSNENETKTRERIWKQSSNDWGSKHGGLTVVNARHFPKTAPLKDWAEYLLFGGITTTILNFILQNPFSNKTSLPKLARLHLPIWPASPSKDNLIQTKNRDEDLTDTTKIVEEIIECKCPPMFGWSVPPDFIGNPFNFKYECSKKYPHGPDSTEKRKSDEDNFDLDTKINNLTLEECYSAMKEILNDVYETISVDSGTAVKCDEYSKIDYHEITDNGSDKEEDNKLKTLSLTSASEITTEPELVDDGIHPLLQSAPAKEEGENDLLNVEKILERSLSHSLDEFFETETSCSIAVCDPPCSVWCDYLPSAAKETFKKFIQKKGSAKNYKRCSLKPRPVFKRSVSADDAPMYARLNEDLNKPLSLESREMLILRRKDPLSYFKVRSVLMNKGKSISCDSVNRHLFGHSTTGSSMWGKFDGAGSLWRPLPDCAPVNRYPKANMRGYTTRLQRTLN